MRLALLAATSIAALAASLFAGCANSTASRPASATTSTRAADPVIEPEAFAAALAAADDRRIILDCRKLEDFAPAHIAGSRRVDLADWSKLSRSQGGLDDAAAWSDRIGALGISDSSRVFVLDAGGMTDAARVWFLLQRFGVRDVRVVNGGWKNLQPLLADTALQRGTSSAVVPASFTARVQSSAVGVTSRDDLKSIAAKKSAAVLDVRTVDEYTGKSAKEGERGGHVPTATNLPHRDMLDDNGRLRPTPQLREMLGAKNLKTDEEVVVYCQSGGRASLAALAAVRAGYTNVTNYYMSMGEWLGDESCPIQK